MPQMAPMWWTTIMMMTTLMMFLMMTMNYFLMNKSVKKSMSKPQMFMNWKW